MARPSTPAGTWRGLPRGIALALALVTVSALLAGCGSGSGKSTLVWYINPDPSQPPDFKGAFGQAGIAERCSTDRYTIVTQQLPGDSSQQRIQLARRLAAQDPGIDLMSLDPVFTGEFANAGFLAPVPAADAAAVQKNALKGAVEAATFKDKVVVTPLWANTQLLWYRKSFAQKAGLDMSKPVTWQQIIDAASKNGGTVGVQANKYEGYAVWINALIAGAGGDIVSNPAKGADAGIDIGSPAGQDAASVISSLAHSKAAEPDLSVSNEGTVLGPFATDQGAFQVNWTFTYANYKADKKTFDDLGWAPYPQTVAGQPAKPPLGGINIGVNTYSTHKDLANEAVRCITNQANQVQYAVETGNMPADAAAYDAAALKKAYPPELLATFSKSIDIAGPRPITPYWSDISSAIQSEWHPPASVNDQTPKNSATFIEDVLHGKTLL
jgi:multiple sugar transport system substrate-binding protein